MPLISNKILYLEAPKPPELQEKLSDWKEKFPKGGVLALVAEARIDIVETLQIQANELGYPLAGAVFPALIVEGKLINKGILLFSFAKMPAYAIAPIPAQASDITRGLGLDVDGDDEQALFMIFDSMIPNISTIIDDTYLKIGDVVNYMGVNAGSETFQAMNCLFDNHQFVGDAVLLLLMKEHQGAILEHGYSNPKLSISATSTTGNHISSIDWRPAFDVYKELALSHYGIEITKDNFYEHAAHFPFGIVRMDGEMLVRIPVALEDDGSIFCVGEVPENSVLTLLKAVSPGSSETVDALLENIEDRQERSVLTFYCAGRRMHLGDAAEDELTLLNTRLSDKHVVGALSLGEIGGAKQGGYPLFHNAALVTIPW